MPPRSTVDLLPSEVRKELDHRLMESAFGGYEGHAAWLAESGHTVSTSALKRYGRRRMTEAAESAARADEITAKAVARARTATELATAMRRAAGDDELAVPQATIDMMMMRMQEALANDEMDVKALQALAQSINQNMRAMASFRQQRELVRQQAFKEAADRADLIVRKRNLDPDVANALRMAIRTPPDGVELSG